MVPALLFLAAQSPDWVEVVVIVLLMSGGAIQAIVKKLREKDQKPSAGRRRTEAGSAPADAEARRTGLERWRELERGGGPVAVERPPVPPASEPPPRRPRPQRPQRRPPVPAPAPEPEPWLPQAGLEEWRSGVGSSPFAGSASEEELTRRLDEAQPVTRAPETARPAAPRRARPRARELLAQRDAWRGAILASEVLGRPVTLRRPEELPGRIPG